MKETTDVGQTFQKNIQLHTENIAESLTLWGFNKFLCAVSLIYES
jgi:hypothetical protein